MRRFAALSFVALLLGEIPSPSAAPESKISAREALKPFNLLIGKWNGSGIPEGTADEKQKGHWIETLDWVWQFKGDDAWLIVTFEKGKYFTRGELRHLPKDNTFQLKLETADKKSSTFQGSFKDRYLTLERTDEKTNETQKLVFSLLHSNRITYIYEVKPAEKTFFTKLYRVGATKDGEPLVATGFNEKQCVVTGGLGTKAVTYMGKTYYVCCSGCRDAFEEEPAKYVAEFEKKRAKANAKKDK